MSCRPADIIRTSALKERVWYRDGDTHDIISVILATDKIADKYVDAAAAACLEGSDDYDTLRNVWAFVRNNVQYKADKRGYEVVKSPGALFALGKGDCKSFSIAEAAILRALGFKGIRYRFVGYNGDYAYTHVYVVCKLNGEDVILDAVHNRFDEEIGYSRKKDIQAVTAASKVAGIGARFKPVSINGTITVFSLCLILWGANNWK